MKLIFLLFIGLTAFAAAPRIDPELCPVPLITRAMSDVMPVRNGAWATASTWGGAVPLAGAKVVIPAGRIVTLDTNTAHLSGLDIHGTVKVARKATSITTGYIIVHPTGQYLVGTIAQPHTQLHTITLTGDNRTATVMGGRVLGVMGGGKLELIGKPLASWTMLANGKTAAVGATKLFLQDWPVWKKGDQIIITSTDLDYAQTEKRTITAVSSTAKTITLDAPLKYLHYGNITTVNHGVAGVPTTIDERAEVALLTRNIKIQGAQGIPGVEDSETNGYGGHVMVMNDTSIALLQGVELYNMGQKGLLGRYPMHWHNVNNGGSNSWMRNCSTHKSFNRGTTIHKTNNITISDNVIYDTLGHGYFFEDGKETGNVLTRNLVALVHRGILDVNFLVFGSQTPNSGQPSAFWITNPNNTFIDNVAAGQAPGGIGFWYDIHSAPRPGSISDDPSYLPFMQPFGVFRGNRAHSASTPLQEPNGEAAWGFFMDICRSPNPILIEDFTTFKNQGGQVWFTGNFGLGGGELTVVGSHLSGDKVLFNQHLLKDSLAVGRTGNPYVLDVQAARDRNMELSYFDPAIGQAALVGYDRVALGEHSVFANYRGVFQVRTNNSNGGGVTDCTFLNSAGFKTSFIANFNNFTAEQAEDFLFKMDDTRDSFGNGAPGFFTYSKSLTVAGAKNVATGAKGLEATDTIGWWSPFVPTTPPVP